MEHSSEPQEINPSVGLVINPITFFVATQNHDLSSFSKISQTNEETQNYESESFLAYAIDCIRKGDINELRAVLTVFMDACVSFQVQFANRLKEELSCSMSSTLVHTLNWVLYMDDTSTLPGFTEETFLAYVKHLVLLSCENPYSMASSDEDKNDTINALVEGIEMAAKRLPLDTLLRGVAELMPCLHNESDFQKHKGKLICAAFTVLKMKNVSKAAYEQFLSKTDSMNLLKLFMSETVAVSKISPEDGGMACESSPDREKNLKFEVDTRLHAIFLLLGRTSVGSAEMINFYKNMTTDGICEASKDLFMIFFNEYTKRSNLFNPEYTVLYNNDLCELLEYETERVKKSFQPPYHLCSEKGFSLLLRILNANYLYLDKKALDDFFWIVASNMTEPGLKRTAILEADKMWNAESTFFSVLMEFSEFLKDEKVAPRKSLLKKLIARLLDFYKDLANEKAKRENTAYAVHDKDETVRVSVTFGDITKLVSLPVKVEITELIDKVRTLHIGADEKTFFQQYDTRKARLRTVNFDGEASAFVLSTHIFLKNISDVIVEFPKKETVLESAKVHLGGYKRKLEWETEEDAEDKKYTSQPKDNCIWSDDDEDMEYKKEEGFSNETKKWENGWGLDTNGINKTFLFGQHTSSQNNIKYIYKLLHTDIKEEEESNDFEVEEAALEAISIILPKNLTTDYLPKSFIDELLFTKNPVWLYSELYCLIVMNNLSYPDRISVGREVLSTLSHETLGVKTTDYIKYLCENICDTTKKCWNRVYTNLLEKMLDVIVPLCTFTAPEKMSIVELCKGVVLCSCIDNTTKIKIFDLALGRTFSEHCLNYETLSYIKETVIGLHEHILNSVISPCPSERETSSDLMHKVCTEIEKVDKGLLLDVFEKYFPDIWHILETCREPLCLSEYFNLLIDILDMSNIERRPGMVNGLLQRLQEILLSGKECIKPGMYMVLKLFNEVLKKCPGSLNNVPNKKKLVEVIFECSSFSPAVTSIMRTMWNESEDFKPLITAWMKDKVNEFCSALPHFGWNKITKFPFANSLEVCFLHQLSNIPLIERAFLDADLGSHSESNVIQEMQSLIIYLRYGCKNALNYEDAYKITDIMEKFGILMGNDNISKIIGFTKEIISCVTNGPDALRSLEIEVGLGGSCDDTCNGIILSVPANETVLESINNLDSDYGYYATYYTKPLFSKLPQTLLVHLIHNSKEEHNCMTHPEDTLPLRNNAISTKGEEPPEAYDNYRLKGVITRTELDGKTEYSSYIKGIQGKWIDFNEEPTSMNNIFRPRTKPLILMYTRPFIAGIDENTFYDSKKTLTEPCDNGSVTVKFLDILTNWPLIAHLDDERKRRDYLKKAASPERFHHFLQMLDINENPEGIIKYLLYTTAVNENAICIEGEEWMNSFTKRINSNPRWRKALLAAIKERYIFSFWETCKNEKLLGGITDLCTEAVVSECLQYREFYELVTQLVEYCTNHKECFGCLLMIQKLWKNDDRNKTILCDTELYAALAKTIIENKESKREVEKKTTEIATDLITQFIIFILRLEKVNAQDKEEFNRTLFRDNTIREILEINKDQEACKQLIKCVTNNNKIALLQMASIIVELLYLSKSVEDDTRIFSFIDAYIGTEDGFTDVRKRLVVTPNLFPKYGILAVYHRAREMSLDRLTLYTNFLIKLDPDQLSHWKPDIAALNNLLMCKLEIIIDKKIVYEALTECESRYMRSQEDHKNWLMEIKGFKALGEKDKDLLEQVVRFKENVSNPILLQKIPKETTKTRTKNTFSKTILAALAAQSNNTNDKFLNTTEGLVVVYKLFSQSQK